MGDPEVTGQFLEGKKRRPSQNHYPRVLAWCEEQGWWPIKVETLIYDPRTQMMRKQDLLGFIDILAFHGDGKPVAIQVTTKDNVAAHLRKYVDPRASSGKVLIAPAVRRWVQMADLLILGFHKPATRWEFTVTTVTPELLDKVLSRRRK